MSMYNNNNNMMEFQKKNKNVFVKTAFLVLNFIVIFYFTVMCI